MKNKSLTFQIWLVIAGITLSVSLVFMALVPGILRGFFTRQMYATIKESQEMYLSNGRILEIKDLVKWDQRSQEYQSVKHIVFLDDGRIVSGYPTATIRQNFQDILIEAMAQQDTEKQYSRQIEDERMYYMVRKGELAGHQAFILSYMWESYQNDLVSTLFNRLLWIIALLLIISWVPAFLLARYLSRPLVTMEEHVRRIANRDWYEPLICDRNDEIGRLGQSIERMRERLVHQNEAQQSFLQHISHELKTPVMVIRSYAQAIADGIFPRGGLEGSIKVIDSEASRLEKRIRDLLYLTKLDYLSNLKPDFENIQIGELIKNVVDLLRWQRPELKWEVDTQELTFCGDREQWKIALENILDNQIRYAQTRISIKTWKLTDEHTIRIKISNDGPPIEAELFDKLFVEYKKGYKGHFGLGLAIVGQIAAYHNSRVWAENESNGVAFHIEVPADNFPSGSNRSLN